MTKQINASGAALMAIMSDFDKGPQYALVKCAEHEGCDAFRSIDNSISLTDEQVTRYLVAEGWSVSPTRCPMHNRVATIVVQI